MINQISNEYIGYASFIILAYFIFMLIWVLSDRKFIGGIKEFIDMMISVCCLFVSIIYNFGSAIIILCSIMVIFYFYKLNLSGVKYEKENKKIISKN
jgi:hypothetical protein